MKFDIQEEQIIVSPLSHTVGSSKLILRKGMGRILKLCMYMVGKPQQIGIFVTNNYL